MDLVSGHESLFWRSAIVGLSQSLIQASSSRGRLIWFQESRGQLCVWSKEHFGESHVFSAEIGVFTLLMSASVRMHRKRASRSRFVKDIASPEVGRVSERTRFKRSSSVRSAPSRRMSPWSVLFRTKMRCRCNFGIRRNGDWRRTVVSFAMRNVKVLEARSTVYAVRYAESSSPPGRFMILSDNLALVLSPMKSHPNPNPQNLEFVFFSKNICVEGLGSVF